VKRYQKHFVSFSDLTPEEENQLYSVDDHPDGEDHDNSFRVGGKRITPELLAEALRTLPEEKRNAVMLYYFHDMSDADIAKLYNIPRSTVQYRRTSSLETIKQFLEERADDETDEW
jgi:RNA polymerase sigma factor (sigma-70 family)